MGVTMVPLNVHFGDQVFRDRVDLDDREFFRRLRSSPKLPTTSQPSVGAFEEVFQQHRAAGEDVVSIHLSGKVSGTCNAARMAAATVDGDHIQVIDSLTVSMAMGFLVLEAARLARAGAEQKEVSEHVNRLVPRARVVAVIDTLTYLERGGRIGKAQALLGSLLNVKPLITLRDGEVHPLGRARSQAQALDRVIQILEREGAPTHLAVLHGAAEAEALKLRQKLAERYPHLEIPLAPISPVLGTYTGPGVLGYTCLLS